MRSRIPTLRAIFLALALVAFNAPVTQAATTTLFGYVRNAQAQPIDGTVVQALAGGSLVGEVVTGPTGLYEFSIELAQVDLKFLPPASSGASSLAAPDIELPRSRELNVVLTQPTAGRIFLSGQVLSAGIGSIGSAIFGDGGMHSDESGYFHYGKPAGVVGKWGIAGRGAPSPKSSYWWRWSGQTIHTYLQDTYEEFNMPMVTTSMTVRSPRGDVIPNAIVEYKVECGACASTDTPRAMFTGSEELSGAVSFGGRGTTDGNGVVQFMTPAILSEAPIWISIIPPTSSDVAAETFHLSIGVGNQEFVLALTKTLITLSGSVVGSGGEVGSSVVWFAGNGYAFSGSSFAMKTLTNASGFWGLQWGQGDFRALFNVLNGSVGTEKSYSANTTIDMVVPLAKQKIKVIDDLGNPVPRVLVRVSYHGIDDATSPPVRLSNEIDPLRVNWWSSVMTDAEGRAEIQYIPMATPIVATYAVFPDATTVWIPKSVTNATPVDEVVVTLSSQSLRLTGRVGFSDGSALPKPTVWHGDSGYVAAIDGTFDQKRYVGTSGTYQVTCRPQFGLVVPDPLCPYISGTVNHTLTADTHLDFVMPILHYPIKILDPSGAPISDVEVRLSPDQSTYQVAGEAFVGTWRGLATTQNDGWADVPGLVLTETVEATLTISPPLESRYLAREIRLSIGPDKDTIVVLAIKPPVLLSVSDASVRPGGSLTVLGANLIGLTDVKLGGVPCRFLVTSDSRVSVFIPSGATSGLLEITNGGGSAQSASIIQVLPSDLAINNGLFSRLTVGRQIDFQFVATGGLAPYFWTRTGLGLPRGLALSVGGAITGVPTTAGTYNFFVSAVDSVGSKVERGVTIEVVDPLSILNGVLPTGQVDQVYGADFASAGGYGPYEWTSIGLPSGVVLTPGGNLSGTIGSAGSYSVQFFVRDADGRTASKVLTIEVLPTPEPTPQPIISTNTLPQAKLSRRYSVQLTGVPLTKRFSWQLVLLNPPPSRGLKMPLGLSFSSSGLISGIPRQKGTFVLTVRLVNSNGVSISKQYTLVIKR